jgi:hypothetical protein
VSPSKHEGLLDVEELAERVVSGGPRRHRFLRNDPPSLGLPIPRYAQGTSIKLSCIEEEERGKGRCTHRNKPIFPNVS